MIIVFLKRIVFEGICETLSTIPLIIEYYKTNAYIYIYYTYNDSYALFDERQVFVLNFYLYCVPT